VGGEGVFGPFEKTLSLISCFFFVTASSGLSVSCFCLYTKCLFGVGIVEKP
jgi:hypothetical protein